MQLQTAVSASTGTKDKTLVCILSIPLNINFFTPLLTCISNLQPTYWCPLFLSQWDSEQVPIQISRNNNNLTISDSIGLDQ